MSRSPADFPVGTLVRIYRDSVLQKSPSTIGRTGVVHEEAHPLASHVICMMDGEGLIWSIPAERLEKLTQ